MQAKGLMAALLKLKETLDQRPFSGIRITTCAGNISAQRSPHGRPLDFDSFRDYVNQENLTEVASTRYAANGSVISSEIKQGFVKIFHQTLTKVIVRLSKKLCVGHKF